MTKTLEERREDFARVFTKLAQMSDEEVSQILKDSEQVHKGIGGNAVKLKIEDIPIFAKQIRLTDLEREHPYSTANLFNLPTYYQYGIGSAGMGAWRELKAHEITTNWVLNGECPNFPMLYGHRVIPIEESRELNEEDREFLEADKKYWGNSPEVHNRINAIEGATHSIVIFLESIPKNLDKYLREENPQNPRNLAMIEREIRSTTDFMESKGMIHFDAHRWNLLTDGEHLYFSDFGLTTSREFELSESELEFFEKNHGYDLALAFNYLGWRPRDENKQLITGAPEVEDLSEKHQNTHQRMQRFLDELRADPKKSIRFPAEEMRELCKDTEEREKETFAQQHPSKSNDRRLRSKSHDSFLSMIEDRKNDPNQRGAHN